MIDQLIVDFLTRNGWTAYKAGNDTDIDKKPCVVVGITSVTQPWIPLMAKEFQFSITLINQSADSGLEDALMIDLTQLPLPENCDLFQITDKSGNLENDDWVTVWTARYISQ